MPGSSHLFWITLLISICFICPDLLDKVGRYISDRMNICHHLTGHPDQSNCSWCLLIIATGFPVYYILCVYLSMPYSGFFTCVAVTMLGGGIQVIIVGMVGWCCSVCIYNRQLIRVRCVFIHSIYSLPSMINCFIQMSPTCTYHK